jgi:hypothetical protein
VCFLCAPHARVAGLPLSTPAVTTQPLPTCVWPFSSRGCPLAQNSIVNDFSGIPLVCLLRARLFLNSRRPEAGQGTGLEWVYDDEFGFDDWARFRIHEVELAPTPPRPSRHPTKPSSPIPQAYCPASMAQNLTRVQRASVLFDLHVAPLRRHGQHQVVALAGRVLGNLVGYGMG